MKAFVTGSCGFVATHLVDRLVADGHEVIGFDANSVATDRRYYTHPPSYTICGDIRDAGAVTAAMKDCDTVFHLGAVADIRDNWKDPERIFRINATSTLNVLEAMLANGIRTIAFASSSAVYGEHPQLPTPEDCSWPVQTSLYGASKVASEALIQAYCAGQGFSGYIFRFSPVVGERYTHGHIFDFVKRLLVDPTKLEVRGNGGQKKPYVYVGDVVRAMMHVMGGSSMADYPYIYNVTNLDAVSLNQSVAWIIDEMGLTPIVAYGTELIGWSGDMPVLWPSSEKLRKTGWFPQVTTEDGIRRSVRWLLENQWALEERK